MFILECSLRLYGSGNRFFFRDKWNKIDFFITLITVIDVVFQNAQISSDYMGIVKVFRILRIIKLAKKIKGIDTLVNTIVMSVP